MQKLSKKFSNSKIKINLGLGSENKTVMIKSLMKVPQIQ